ncbi:calmodulin-binding receptor-like cytoplasmic kinase 3 [Papaver somniferum]|uniref:calmodulin-binding receptor-like cytoplasmic kinase 3 n=1 Tax=Papaver somniferum TaxID=3469 RepID=UPI000E6FDC34|nr:calmodulin-binding receptor-like cytoplasmic kinase 3 [Papaver somniferum]
MGVVEFILLCVLVIQLLNPLVNGWTKDCIASKFTYSRSSDQQDLFYINGNKVGKESFCKALEYCYQTVILFDTISEEEPGGGGGGAGRKHCDFKISSGGLPQKVRRKFLLGSTRDISAANQADQKKTSAEEKHSGNTLLTTKTVGMAVAGMFLLCCSFICPCFRSRKKDISEVGLTKDHSTNSTSSLGSTSSEKLPGSPVRTPASPFKVPPSPSRFSMSPKSSEIGSVHLSMSQILKATQNFSPSLLIGEGGFGTVYRAQLQDGPVVAVKRAKKENLNSLQAEFSSEVELLSKIEHRNLVRLLGYVDKGNERIIITEFVPNGTLREHLDGQHGKILDFYQRLEISIDIAHALAYLHLYAEKEIIHRDVKSSNILLTENLKAKVADFGFARAGPQEVEKTHISTKVKGTAGYLDPEYLRTYQLTTKSDVFSFGVLLIEILTARRPVEMRRAADERITVRWAFKNYKAGKLVEMLDPSMTEAVHIEILSKMFSLAFQCAAPTRRDRPNMKEAGEQLWEIRMNYLKSGKRGG